MGDEAVPAFEVINQDTGHRYKVYADGQVRGFGESVFIINRIPRITLAAAAARQKDVVRHG